MEDSLDEFQEEIKGKSKRERVLKEQQKKVSRLSFGDEGVSIAETFADATPVSDVTNLIPGINFEAMVVLPWAINTFS